MANGPTTNGNGAVPNGKAIDPSADFKGDIKVNNKAPTKEQLEKVAEVQVLDANKKSYTFKSLYADNENGPRRVLVVFIRHFFCGVCQEYVRTLSSSIPPTTLITLSPPTSIAIIGCGSPDLIPMYIQASNCAFPIYADPTRRLYNALGMTSTLSLGGQTPDYMNKKGIMTLSIRSVVQELRSGRMLFSGGDYRQVGGEFLFANGKVMWCHRMRNTRDHAEVEELRRQLKIEEPGKRELNGESPRARKRWSTAGLGAGLGRRLSSRRRSWAPNSYAQSEARRGSPPGMEGLKEEETATPKDALAKLEGKAPPAVENGSPLNGTTNEDKIGNGAPIAGTRIASTNDNMDGPVNDTMDNSTHGAVAEAAVESKVLHGAEDGMANGLTAPTTTHNTAPGPVREAEIESKFLHGAEDGLVNGLTSPTKAHRIQAQEQAEEVAIESKIFHGAEDGLVNGLTAPTTPHEIKAEAEPKAATESEIFRDAEDSTHIAGTDAKSEAAIESKILHGAEDGMVNGLTAPPANTHTTSIST